MDKIRPAVLIAALALAATAQASPDRAATVAAAFPPGQPGAAATVDLHMTWADPSEPDAKPLGLKLLRLDFAPGTRIDTAALRRCKASDKRIAKRGPAACPRKTRLGTGRSVLTSGQQQLAAKITLINARRQIIVVVRVGKSVLAVYRDDVVGASVTVNFALPPSLSLLDLRIHIPVHRHGRRIYFRSPRTCPDTGALPMTATSTYVDGVVQQAQTTTPCTG